MTTLFVDLENGNDNYAGSSFEPLASGTDGRITGTTFSSATASFPNDGSLIDQYLSIFNGSIYAVYKITAWVSATSLTINGISGGSSLASQAVDRQYYVGGRWKTMTSGATALRIAPGDEIRIMGSPAPTSLGQDGVWTSAPLAITRTISTIYGAETPIRVTFGPPHGFSTGDTVYISNASATRGNGTWEITVISATEITLNGSIGEGNTAGGGTARLRSNSRVMLATPVTQTIASTGSERTTWTASPNVSTSFGTTYKESYRSDQIAISSTFTTGLAAYWTLPSPLDLSGYQQVSFWVLQSAGAVQAITTGLELRLCSDTLGTTAVNTIPIPIIGTNNRWVPVTVDLGVNLGDNIQSIALYVVTDFGVTTVLFNNIIACKASSEPDSLTLSSLIGKNTTGEAFWGIQSIDGTRVMLDSDNNGKPVDTTVRGYYGISETVTTWKRETIKLPLASASGTVLMEIMEGGTEESILSVSGGWDRTDMSTQTSDTLIDGRNGLGYALRLTSKSFVRISKFGFVRLHIGISASGTGCVGCDFQDVYCSNMSYGLFDGEPFSVCTASIKGQVASLQPILVPTSFGRITLDGPVASNNSAAFQFNPGRTFLIGTPNALVANNGGFGMRFNFGDCFIYNITSADNATASIYAVGQGTNYFKNFNSNEATVASYTGSVVTQSLQFQNFNSTPGNYLIDMNGGRISSAVDQRKTASGISWKFQPTSVNRSSVNPIELSLAKVACAANSLVTVKAWMRRDNSGLTMRLVCKGDQIAGVTDDVTSSISTTNDWEELTISFTPTEVGVVEITAEVWGGTTFSGWVDDLTISQA